MYRSGQNRYLSFCAKARLQDIPTQEAMLCKFVAQLAIEGLRHATIKSYMAGIRYLHIENGLGNPFLPSWSKLHYVLRMVKWPLGKVDKRERLPITPPLLRKIMSFWDAKVQDYDIIMLWAACCLAYFGFLHAVEQTVPSDSAFDSSIHLSWGDLAVDNPESQAIMSVTLKASMMDPFHKGVTLYIGWVSSD